MYGGISRQKVACVFSRYRPLEFNGWTQRHWTLPFEGERFSVVWFTPRGCEGRSLRDEAAAAAASSAE